MMAGLLEHHRGQEPLEHFQEIMWLKFEAEQISKFRNLRTIHSFFLFLVISDSKIAPNKQFLILASFLKFTTVSTF